MKPDYKNWMPKGMVLGTLAGSVGCFGLAAVCGEGRDDRRTETRTQTSALLRNHAGAGRQTVVYILLQQSV
jgi:hypothetical protein